MAQQTINVGSTPNDGTGDQLRSAMIKIQNNFSELYGNVTSSFSSNVGIGGVATTNKLFINNYTTNTNTVGEYIYTPIVNSAVDSTVSVRALRVTVYSESEFKNSTSTNTATVTAVTGEVFNGDSAAGGDARVSTAYGLSGAVYNYANGVTSNTLGTVYPVSATFTQGNTAGVTNIVRNVRSVISNSGNNISITAPVLFYGDYTGNTLTNSYGLWISDETKNYISGNTGIGTSSPNAKLQVSGTANISGAVALSNTLAVTGAATFSSSLTVTGASTIANINFGTGSIEVNAGGTGDRNALVDLHSDDTYPDYSFRMLAGAGYNGLRQIVARGTTGLYLDTQDSAPIVFRTTLTEAARISASGNVGIGNTAPNAKLHVTGTANISGDVTLGTSLTISTNTLNMGSANVGAANFANGYARLPNGLLMQFGQLLVNTTTAAQTFSTVTGAAFTNIFSMTATSNSSAAIVGLTTLNATGFTLVSNTTANVAVYWSAIGK